MDQVKSISKLFVIPHSHIDIEWYWTYDQLINICDDIFKKNLFPIMAKDKNFTFVQDQSIIFEILDNILDDENKKLLEDRIKEDKFEITGGMYVQPEVAEPHGECLIRQIKYGKEWLKKRFNTEPISGWFIDTFGLIPQLAQILIKSGFNSLTFMRDIPLDRDPKNFNTEFYYISPDGSKILTHWMSQTYVMEKEPKFGTKLLGLARQMTTDIAFLPWGNDLHCHDMNTDEIKQYINDEAKRAGVEIGEIIFGTAKQFFCELETKVGQLPSYDFDLNPPLNTQDLRGLYETRIKLKLLNRNSEYLLMTLERLLASCSLIEYTNNLKNDYNLLQNMWLDVLYNQFHDIMGGSCIDESYIVALQKYKNVNAKSRRLIDRTLSSVDSKTPKMVLVYNPISFERNGIARVNLEFFEQDKVETIVIKDENKNRVNMRTEYEERYENGAIKKAVVEFYISAISQFSMRRFEVVVNEPGVCSCSANEAAFLENEYFKVSISQETGCITSIFNKLNGQEIIEQGGLSANDILFIEEESPDMEGKICFTDVVHKAQSIKADSIKIFEDNLVSRAIVSKHFLDFKIVQSISLYKGVDRVDFKTDLLNDGYKNVFVKITFPLNLNKESAVPYYETAFAATKRPHGHYCAQKWAGLFDENMGIALLNKGACGYWTDKNVIDLCVLRTYQDFDMYRKNGIDRDMHLFKDFRTHAELAKERSYYEFEYSLVSTTKKDFAKITKDSEKFNFPLYTTPAKCCDNIKEIKSPIKVESENFIITYMGYNCNDASFTFRGYETSGQVSNVRIKIGFNCKEIFVTNLLEEKQERIDMDNGYYNYECKPYEIVTFKSVL